VLKLLTNILLQHNSVSETDSEDHNIPSEGSAVNSAAANSDKEHSEEPRDSEDTLELSEDWADNLEPETTFPRATELTAWEPDSEDSELRA
jgi:hypothetical protein